jgi:hypothetical protein
MCKRKFRSALFAVLLTMAGVVLVGQVVSVMAQMSGSSTLEMTNVPMIQEAGSTSATISWSTNVPSSSRVWYGTDVNNLTELAQAPWGGTNHQVRLSNLKPGTTYYFQVESEQGRGAIGEAESRGVLSFRTVASGAQPVRNQPATVAQLGLENEYNGAIKITNGPLLEYLDDRSAILAWSTNVKGSTRVNYGTDQHNLTELAEAPWGANGLTHRVRIQNLQPDRTYYYQIESGQAQGTGAEVEGAAIVFSFHTNSSGQQPVHNQAGTAVGGPASGASIGGEQVRAEQVRAEAVRRQDRANAQIHAAQNKDKDKDEAKKNKDKKKDQDER